MICAKDNPFAVSRIHALGYIPFTVSWEALMRRLTELNFTAAIVGDHGSGKTTLLEALEKRLQISGIRTDTVFISNDIHLPWGTVLDKMKLLPAGGVLFFDGACHLSRWRWRQLRRQANRQKIGMVITSHDERLLPTLVCCRPQPDVLIELVKLLTGDIDPELHSDCVKLFAAHRGNIRECLRQLYDMYADGT
jgi:ABC-type dipeptide/oligopeptide/nickel transport system ATPase component